MQLGNEEHAFGGRRPPLQNRRSTVGFGLASYAPARAEWRAKMETKLSGNGGRGREKGADSGEAGGRSAQSVYTCFNCGALNYVDPSWTWFTCWKCNLQKPVPLPGPGKG